MVTAAKTIAARTRTRALPEPLTAAQVNNHLGKWDNIVVSTGANGSVVLHVPGLAIALVQPENWDSSHWNDLVHKAKEDLDAAISRKARKIQGVVFLPYNTKIRHSSFGAADMGDRGITYRVSTVPQGGLMPGLQYFLSDWKTQTDQSRAHLERMRLAMQS